MIGSYEWAKFELDASLREQLVDLMYRTDQTLAGIAEGLGESTTYVRQLFDGRQYLTMKTLIKIVSISGGELGISGGDYYIKSTEESKK